MKFTLFSLVSLLAMAMALFSAEAEARPAVGGQACLGIAWAADNRWAPQLATNVNTCAYHHWEMAHVPELSRRGIKFVPMLWGPSKMGQWNRLRKLFPRYRYSHALFLNEPDVPSQSNVSPGAAAALFMKQMKPLQSRFGTKVSSPNICYNIDWLKKFTRILNNKGGRYDFVAAHYYGPYTDFNRFKNYIVKLHKTFPGYQLWITEYGLTQASNPSPQAALNFMSRATDFMHDSGYVKVYFPFGTFAITNPPDAFGAAQNAMFTGDGRLRPIGRYFAYSTKRRSLDESEAPKDIRRRHHAMMLRMRDADDAADAADPAITVEKPTDCDESNPRDNCKFLKGLAEQDDSPLDLDSPLSAEELKELEAFDHEFAKRDVEDLEEADESELLSELDL